MENKPEIKYEIRVERDFSDLSLLNLLNLHKEHCEAETPIESCHRLDVDGLRAPELTFWVAWQNDQAVGMIGLKQIDNFHGEVKSMHVLRSVRGAGLADRLFNVMLDEARARQYNRLSLETGISNNFQAAMAFYARHGFKNCSPFDGYTKDPNSVFMSLTL